MTEEQVAQALAAAGFCGIEREGGVVFARVAAQAPEFRAEPVPGGWQLVLPWNVRPPEDAIAQWNARMGDARITILRGEAALVMPFAADALPRWAALAAEAEAHFIRWRRGWRPLEGM